MRLVIGTRHYLGPEWTHYDISGHRLISDDGQDHFPEIIGDARNVPLEDETCELVYSQECLEHFPWTDTPLVVREWARLVRPGGQLRIEVPDFLAACQQVLTHDTLDMDLRIQQIIFGGQVNQWDFHYAGLTHRTLPHFVEEQGLTVTKVLRGWEHGWLMVEATR